MLAILGTRTFESWRVECYQHQNQRVPILSSHGATNRSTGLVDVTTARKASHDDCDDDYDSPPDDYEAMDTHRNELGVCGSLGVESMQGSPTRTSTPPSMEAVVPSCRHCSDESLSRSPPPINKQQRKQLSSSAHSELTFRECPCCKLCCPLYLGTLSYCQTPSPRHDDTPAPTKRLQNVPAER
jgi:hypothetical protein